MIAYKILNNIALLILVDVSYLYSKLQ